MYRLNTKIRLTMLCLSGFEVYSRWVPLAHASEPTRKLDSIPYRACILLVVCDI